METGGAVMVTGSHNPPDDRGEILFGDHLLIVLARDVLVQHPGATIIADVKASQVLYDEIARAGGKPEMYKTGHSLIKARMADIGAPLAGEMSGHIFFADRTRSRCWWRELRRQAPRGWSG